MSSATSSIPESWLKISLRTRHEHCCTSVVVMSVNLGAPSECLSSCARQWASPVGVNVLHFSVWLVNLPSRILIWIFLWGKKSTSPVRHYSLIAWHSGAIKTTLTARDMECRVLSIQSHVVRGYVGNKSASFPLQVSSWSTTMHSW